MMTRDGVIEIRLTDAEVKLAEYVATTRNTSNIKRGIDDPWPGEPLTKRHILGVRAELTAAIVTHRPWFGVDTLGNLKAPDLWPDLEVRGTRLPTGGMIIKDPRNKGFNEVSGVPYIAVMRKVRDSNDVLVIHGWMHHDQATEGGIGGRYWCEKGDRGLPKACWCVPQEELLDISALVLEPGHQKYRERKDILEEQREHYRNAELLA